MELKITFIFSRFSMICKILLSKFSWALKFVANTRVRLMQFKYINLRIIL